MLWSDTIGDLADERRAGLSGPDLGNVPISWAIAESGEFNGDGYSDILWRDTAADLAIWFMKGKRSGGIEARTGLRMMPSFPRSPLSFAE